MIEASGNLPSTPQRISFSSSPKKTVPSSTAVSSTIATKKNSVKSQPTANVPNFNKSEVIPVIVPRNSIGSDMTNEPKKEVGIVGRTMPLSLQSKANEFRRFPSVREDADKPSVPMQTELAASKGAEFSVPERNMFPRVTSSIQAMTSEKSTKDERFFPSAKHEMSSTTEPIASCQPDSCKYLVLKL